MGKKKKKGDETSQLTHSTLSFKLNEKETVWEVVHNLEDFKLDISAALINYGARDENPNIEGFCEYVKSKDPINIICVTLGYYKKLEKEIEDGDK